MNKKGYIKTGIVLLFVLYICAGCSNRQEEKYTVEDLGGLAEIRIFSAKDNELIKTVSDEEQLYQYNQRLSFDTSDIEERQGELKKSLKGANEQYRFVAYKRPVARFGDGELEENFTITLYEGTNIIKMTVSEESIKAFSVPEEFLAFYFEISDEEMDFLTSLAE